MLNAATLIEMRSAIGKPAPGNSGVRLVELEADDVEVLEVVDVDEVLTLGDSSRMGRMPIGTTPLTDLVVPFSS